MEIRFSEDDSLREFSRLATELGRLDHVESLLVLAGEGNGWTRAQTDPVLQSLGIPLFGGIFPRIVHGPRAYERGFVVAGLPHRAEILCVPGLSDPGAIYEDVLESFAARTADQDGTLMVFVDGLSKRIAALVEALFDMFGLGRNFIGGGAGSLSFRQFPCLITSSGLVEDAAIVALLPARSGVGVAHGWEVASAGMKATQTDRNTILSLDWEPAAVRYMEVVEAHSGQSFADRDFFDLAKAYPFGINRLGGEVVVRDPLSTDGADGLVCVGEVPAGSFVHILNGSSDSLIAAAGRARDLALLDLPDATAASELLVMDCISRALFLGPRLTEELAVVAGSDGLFGAMTLGEIANSGKDYLEFFNKTTVAALLCCE